MPAAPDFDVVIIGAGPAGSVAGSLLADLEHRVHIVERQHFPRFSIGESLLPQCMEFMEAAGLLDAVQARAREFGFQYKNGAAFVCGDAYTDFDFQKKFTPGWGTTYQVLRAPFDDLLARQAQSKGVSIAWGHAIAGADMNGAYPVLGVKDEAGNDYSLTARFVLDASGFGRILPRLLKLELPSEFPVRASLFTHIEDNIVPDEFDREKIRITVHPQHHDVWYWLIPFANGRSSIGVVAREEFFNTYPDDQTERLRIIVNEDPALKQLLRRADYDTPARQITGYASNVSRLCGKHFALLGNAGEFLDPVFSSGVTIAMKSARLAADALHRQLQGEMVDWEADYAAPLRSGVDVFRVFVEAWYDGRLQEIIFSEQQNPQIREMICAILAGYAWDTNNPYVQDSERRINTLAEICRQG